MAAGDPRCVSCHGRGGWRDGFGWHRCHCTRPTRAQAELSRKYNARDDRPFQLPLDGISAALFVARKEGRQNAAD